MLVVPKGLPGISIPSAAVCPQGAAEMLSLSIMLIPFFLQEREHCGSVPCWDECEVGLLASPQSPRFLSLLL